jgi:hypothetical protein
MQENIHISNNEKQHSKWEKTLFCNHEMDMVIDVEDNNCISVLLLLYIMFLHDCTVKPVLRGHLWDKAIVVF